MTVENKKSAGNFIWYKFKLYIVLLKDLSVKPHFVQGLFRLNGT